MKKFIIFLIFIILAITSSIVFAQYTPQSSPGFTGGGTLWGRTAAQVNQYFQNKVDASSGTAYGLTLSQPSVLDTMSFQGTNGNVLTTLPGSNVNIGGSLSVTGNTKFNRALAAPNVLGGSTSLTSSTTLLPSQSGQYIFWQGTSANQIITLPSAKSFASVGFGIFFISNTTSSTNVTIQTNSADYNFLLGLNGSLGGSITLAAGQNIIAIANPNLPAWFGGYQNIMPNLQTTGNITANNITANNITATGNILSNHMVNVIHVISQDVPQSITTTTGTTLSVSVLLGGAILRSGPTAAFTDTLDSASNIVTRIFNPLVNNSFDFTIVNYTSYTMTLAMGTGGTLNPYPSGVSGSPGTIPANNSVKFRLVITGTGSTPSYTVYRISSGGV